MRRGGTVRRHSIETSTQRLLALVSAGALGVTALGAAGAAGAGLHGPVLCPFRRATGLPCPLCGVTRSLLALGERKVGLSLELSPLGLPCLLASALLVAALPRRLRARMPLSWPPVLTYAVLVLVLASWSVQLSKELV